MDSGAALARLRAAYDDPDAIVAEALAAGRRPIRTLGVDAPFDVLRRAGFQPVRLQPAAGATPRADAAMGGKGLAERGRRLLEAMLSPAHPQVPILVTRADAEQMQVFATLRELARLGEASPPPIFMLDLLHLSRAASQAYNAVRLAELAAWLDALGSTPMDAAPHADMAAVLALRRAVPPRLSGSDALRVLGSAAILPADEHAAAVAAVSATEPRDGPRIYLAGTCHEDARFYAAVEALGATIVGEDHGWGERRATGAIVPAASEDPAQVAARVAAAAAASQTTHLLHLTIGDDEVAPWQAAALARALPAGLPFTALRAADADDRFTAAVSTFLQGISEPPTAPRPAASAKSAPRPEDRSRSRKSLDSIADFGRYQRGWFAEVRARAAAGEPFAVVNANAPQEILRALDIPFVVNQWWASIVAAKQQSRRYFGLLRERGYPTDVESYSAQGLAAAFDMDAEQAPWGGLPRPDFLHAVLSSDATAAIFANWAGETGAAPFLYERTVDPRWQIATDWWADMPERWDDALEPARLDLMVAELRTLIAELEAATGRRFSPERFEEVLHLVNEQEDYYRRTRDLIARTVPVPIGIVDSMPATMVPQWHRGTVWARDAAKAFYEEVAARVANGAAAVADERIRLMFVGRGMWSEMGFYQRWEESHGAVFVWSMYLALAADGYIRRFDGGRDPMRALAARFLTMGDELRMPSWAAPWYVHEAATHQVDGVVALADADPFVLRALERAGVPVLDLGVDNFNREGADAAALDARIAAFLEGPAAAKATARRGAA